MRIHRAFLTLFLACFALAVFSVLPAHSQSEAGAEPKQSETENSAEGSRLAVLTLEEAVQLGLKNNYDLRKARQELKSATYQSEAERAANLPTLSLSSEWSIVDDTNLDSPPGQQQQPEDDGGGSVFGSDNHTRTTSLTFSQPISFSLYNTWQAARERRKASYRRLEAREDAVRFQITSAFLEAARSRDRLEVAEEGLKLAKQELSAAETRYEVGSAPEFDVIEAEVGVSNARQNLEQARAEADAAMRELFHTLGVEGVDPESTELDYSFVTEAQDLEELTEQVELEGFPERFIEQNDTYRALTHAKLAQGETADAARNWPSISLFASARDQDVSPFQSGEVYSVGVRGEWDIFDSGESSKRVKSLEAQEESARLDREQFASELRRDLLDAAQQVRVSERNLETAGDARRQAREALRMAQLGFEEGETSRLQLQNARVRFLEAEENLFATKVGFYLAVERVKSLIGYDQYRSAVDSVE